MSQRRTYRILTPDGLYREISHSQYEEEFPKPKMDPTPIAPPVGYKKQPSMFDNIREMIHKERLQQEIDSAGYETMEEADDFDVGDPEDFHPETPYERHFDPVPPAPAPPAASTTPAATPPAAPPSDGPSGSATAPATTPSP